MDAAVAWRVCADAGAADEWKADRAGVAVRDGASGVREGKQKDNAETQRARRKRGEMAWGIELRMGALKGRPYKIPRIGIGLRVGANVIE